MFHCAHKFQHYAYFRFSVLGPFEGIHCPNFHTVHGRFPPEARFNQDQVLLPFIVSMETLTLWKRTATFTLVVLVNRYVKDNLQCTSFLMQEKGQKIGLHNLGVQR